MRFGRRFRDRSDAGRRLAAELAEYRGRGDLLVLALPRGGVPVAFEIARALGAPLDVLIVRKLGVPGHEELAFGAVASGGALVLNDDVVRALGVSPEVIEQVTARERAEMERREAAYRGDRARPGVSGRTVILVDDGIATGASVRVAVRALRELSPAGIVVAAPVAALDSIATLRSEADDVVAVLTPEPLLAIGSWYDDFTQTTDAEVRALLAQAEGDGAPVTAGAHGS